VPLEEEIKRFLASYPRNMGVHYHVSEIFLPRWQGQPTDCARYASRVADTVGGHAGELIYAMLADRMLSRHGRPLAYLDSGGWKYERIVNAFYNRLQVEPLDIYSANRGLNFALLMDDATEARRFLKHIKTHRLIPEFDGWENLDDYRRAQKLAKRVGP
jgi:hypothetical protein